MKVPSYDEVVRTYQLEIVKPGGDFKVTATGDLELTRDGDLKLGNDKFNAMFRLVQGWRFNAPALEILFNFIVCASEEQQKLESERETVFSSDFDESSVQKYHEFQDKIGAYEYSSPAYAGAIIVTLNNLLIRFKEDLKASQDNWKECAPLIEGCSVGSVIEATANNFRHYNEWKTTDPPTRQQLRSIRIIAAVLREPIQPDAARHPFRRNMCPDVLEVLSSGSYDILNRNVFEFAKNMVQCA